MAQSNALRDQPSMDEILASIRRIIDTGESQAKAAAKPEKEIAPEPQATVPPPAANDEGAARPRVPQAGLTQAPMTGRVVPAEAETSIAAAVDDYMKKEAARPAVEDEPASGAIELTFDDLPEPDISEVEEALRAEFNPVDRNVLSAERQAKYDARFTEADSGAFRQVGSLLRGKVEEVMAGAQQRDRRANALVSDAVSQSVSHSFSSLSEMMKERSGRDLDAMAEDMLRPMLQEWLDNNLPSLVERLVRSEIERIARGEPRTA